MYPVLTRRSIVLKLIDRAEGRKTMVCKSLDSVIITSHDHTQTSLKADGPSRNLSRRVQREKTKLK